MFFLALVFVVVALAASLSVGAWRLLRPRGRVPATVGAAAMALVAVGLAPMPIHGGFTTPLFELVDSVRHARPGEVAHDSIARALWEQRIASRFHGALEFTEVGDAGGPWRAVVTSEGERAWLDASTGLVWSRAEPIDVTGAVDLFDAARAGCARRRPTGRWAVPSEAEMISFARSNGASVAGGPRVNDVTVSLDGHVMLEMPMRRVPRGEARGRCVARSNVVPLGGLMNDAVSLDEWNAFQLSK